METLKGIRAELRGINLKSRQKGGISSTSHFRFAKGSQKWSLTNKEIDDTWLKKIGHLKNLESLHLDNTSISDAEDGKLRETDVADVEQLLRLIQSIPSPKAEPFKQWLAKVGYERMQEINNPGTAENFLPPAKEKKQLK